MACLPPEPERFRQPGKIGGASKGPHKRAGNNAEPILDHGLGVLLIGLIVYFCYRLRDNYTLLFIFIACFAGTVVLISAVRRCAGFLGSKLSRSRRNASIPESCRDPLRDEAAMRKFKDQAWQLFVHVFFACYEVVLLRDVPWWDEPASVFVPCPHEQVHSDALHAFYLMQAAVWTWTGLSAKLLEERRRDYLQMLTHHVLTVALVTFSFVHNEHAFGLLVLTAHDVSDVILDLLKLVNYLKLEGGHGWYLTESVFVLNTYVVWPYVRLWVYPFRLVHSVIVDYHALCDDPRPIGCSMLVILAILHVYWWTIMLRMEKKRQAGGQSASEIGDEEYEDVGKHQR